MDGVIFALISPLIIREFALTVPEYRTACRSRSSSASLASISGRGFPTATGGEPLLAVNIALFSLLMPVVALSPTFAAVRDRTVDHRLRPERRVVAGLDAGGGNLAGAPARPRHQHQPRGVVSRRLAGRSDHGHRRRGLGLADSGHGAGRDRAAGDLRARDLPRIALLGAGARTARRAVRGRWPRRTGGRGGPCLVPQGRPGRYPPGLHA